MEKSTHFMHTQFLKISSCHNLLSTIYTSVVAKYRERIIPDYLIWLSEKQDRKPSEKKVFKRPAPFW